MIDIKYARENLDQVKKALEKRNASVDWEKIFKLDDERKDLLKRIETLRAESNELSKSKERNEKAIEIKRMLKDLEPQLVEVEENLKIEVVKIPNIPLGDVPAGKDESENVVLRQVGEKPDFNFKPRDHADLGEALDIIDVKRASNVSGPRFGYIKGKLALLEFALIQFAYSVLTNEEKLKEIDNLLQ